MSLSGAFCSVLVATLTFANHGGPVSPTAGLVAGSLTTLGAFEYAGNPVVTLDDFGSAKKIEQTLTGDQVSKMTNPKNLDIKFV